MEIMYMLPYVVGKRPLLKSQAIALTRWAKW